MHSCIHCSIRYIKPASLLSAVTRASSDSAAQPAVSDEPPPGFVKSILPCTPLAIVKCLENTGVYNTILKYGDRAYGKTITVINRYDQVDDRKSPRCAKLFSFPARKSLADRSLPFSRMTEQGPSLSILILSRNIRSDLSHQRIRNDAIILVTLCIHVQRRLRNALQSQTS